MFYNKRIQQLEDRIKELENAPNNVNQNDIEFFSEYGGNSWITSEGGPTRKRDLYTMASGCRYVVSSAYLLDKILRHLNLNIVFNDSTSANVELVKIKPVKKK